MRRARLFVVVIAVLGMLAAACSKSTSTGGATPSSSGGSQSAAGPSITPASSLKGSGSSFAGPLYSKWAEAFQASNHIQVNYAPSSSGQGIANLTANPPLVDFAGTDVPYAPTQTSVPAILNIPTALGAVVVTYNLPGVTKVVQLSGQTLADIISTKVKKWNDAEITKDNPGVTLPATNITVVHRTGNSGTTYIFTSYLSAVSSDWKSAFGASAGPTWPAGTLGEASSSNLTARVKATPGAIGYVELTYALQNNVTAASLQNADKTAYVAPTVTTTAAAASHFDVSTLTGNNLIFLAVNEPGSDSYPIVGPTYALAYQAQTDGPKGKALVEFLSWGLTTGQGLEAPLSYVALPTALAQKATAAVDSITYNGKPLRSA